MIRYPFVNLDGKDMQLNRSMVFVHKEIPLSIKYGTLFELVQLNAEFNSLSSYSCCLFKPHIIQILSYLFHLFQIDQPAGFLKRPISHTI